MRDPEYDRFGPWMLEISEIDPLPPLFVPYVSTDKEPLLRVKIPRQAERRDLSPGMHMYDYVVCLYGEDMEIHVRDGDSVATFRIAYGDIVAMKNTEDLLNGHLRVYSLKYDYDIPYSTVSIDLVRRMIAVIRERYLESGDPYAAVPEGFEGAAAAEGMGFYFTGFLNALAAEHPEYGILATQAETRVAVFENGFWRRLFFGALDKRLLETVHLTDGRELQIVGRGRTWAYRWNTVYGKETLYLPLAKIRSVERTPDPKNANMVRWLFKTEVSEHSGVLRGDNPAADRYSEWLEGALTA